MVPNYKLPGYHQVKNAEVYEQAKAAVIVEDLKMSEDPELLYKAIKKLLGDKEKREELSANLKKFSKENAAENLAKTVI